MHIFSRPFYFKLALWAALAQSMSEGSFFTKKKDYGVVNIITGRMQFSSASGVLDLVVVVLFGGGL